MKTLRIICAVVLFAFCFWCFELYADHCNTEQSPQSETPSEQPTGPNAPKVVVDENTQKSRIPEIPPYGGPKVEPNTNNGGISVPPKSDPMIHEKTIDHIRTYRRDVDNKDQTGGGKVITTDDGTVVTTTETASCGDCFIVFVEKLTSNYEISERAHGRHFPWERQFEKEAFNKAAAFCTERYKDGSCTSARECDTPREVTTEALEDIYPDDGAARTGGVKTRAGIYFRCAPLVKSPFAVGTGTDTDLPLTIHK